MTPLDWNLQGCRVAADAKRASPRPLFVRRGRVAEQDDGRGKTVQLDGGIVLPGLINAHDHLEFALFPRLGTGIYDNARQWAEDVYLPDEPALKQHLLVPKAARLRWGGLKNLLSGVTTVCHHNRDEPEVFDHSFPLRIATNFGWAHSLHFEPDWLERFRSTPVGRPFIIHLGEGLDEEAAGEFALLEQAGALTERTVIVHGLALSEQDLQRMAECGAKLIWCPSSNEFLFGRSLGPQAFRCGAAIALGSDSPLSAEGDLLDELQYARKCADLPAERLYRMATREAAEALGLRGGALEPGDPADLIVLEDLGAGPAESLCPGERPELLLVMIGGVIKLLSEETAAQLAAQGVDVEGLEPVGYGGRRYRVAAAVRDWPTADDSGQALLAHKAVATR